MSDTTRIWTLVTWNIHSAIGLDGRFDLARVAAVLRELAPDVVLLQEIGDFRGWTPPGDHAAELGAALGLERVFAPNVVRGERRYGNALLSRFPIARSWTVDLSCPGREPRGALLAALDLGTGEPVPVASVHLGLGPRERRVQEERLLRRLAGETWDRLVLGGDWNHVRDRPVASFERARLRDAAAVLGARDRTSPSPLPLFRFDRVFTGERVQPLSLRAHRSPLAVRASDHLPLVARLEALP